MCWRLRISIYIYIHIHIYIYIYRCARECGWWCSSCRFSIHIYA
jgi:hypothetical protein